MGTDKQLQRQLREEKRQLREEKNQLREAFWRPAHMRKPWFSPRTVVDVGVGDGTPALYEAFPEAFQVLIDPLKENEPHLQRILQEYDGEYFLTAVGARDEKLMINVPPNKNRSSIYSRTNLPKNEVVETREIPSTTLDALLEKHDFQPPFGLKIDTEGFEYQVIEGARNFLRKTQFVIAEVNVARIYEGSYSFAAFIKKMDESGFSLCDILGMGGMTSSLELNFVDAMFRKTG